MDLKLTGKKGFISGSTKGIGQAIATSLAREGTHVIINGRSDDAVTTALEQIRSGDQCLSCQVDRYPPRGFRNRPLLAPHAFKPAAQ